MAREGTEGPELVWTRRERGARGPAAGHSRAELAAAAVGLADRDGLAAVSMRQVAKELGVGQSSLYRYIAGREDLLDLMTDAVVGEVGIDVPLSGDPVEDLLALAVRTRAVHVRHPWLSDVPPEPLRTGPRGLDYLDHALAALAPTRLRNRTKLEVIAMMNALIEQLVRAELQGARTDGGRQAARIAYLRDAAARGDRPHLAAAMADAPDAGPADDAQALFERTMRRVITGLLAPEPA